jgi:amino acid permease
VLTYPLPFVGLRDGVLDAWQVPARDRTDKLVNIVSIALLGAVTIVALLVQNLALVLSVGGGTFSTLVAAVFPAIMFRAAVKNHSKSSSGSIDDQIQKRNKFDARLALLLMGISTAIGVTGVGFALSNALH